MQVRFSKRTKQIGAGIVILVALFFVISAVRNGNGEYEELTVARRDLAEQVVLSGTVEARIVADLGFEVTGTVQDVSVTENDVVAQGSRLVSLSLGTLQAELLAAQADATIKRAEAANAEIEVENALSELLSDDLVAEPNSDTYTQTAPVITGRYAGPEGTYKIRIKEQTQPSNFDLYVFDLEEVAPTEINKTGPTAVGTRGLFVSFPDGTSAYRNTTWYIAIPNTKGASYAINYSAFKQAEADLRAQQSGASIVQAQLQKAEAEVARIKAQIAQRILTAPFSGVVTAVAVDPGEAISANSPVVTLISEGGFGVEVDLPEIDSVKVNVGDPVSITLDAFGEEVVFPGTVVSVNRAETLVDNVAVYEARIVFDAADDRIASGMTAEAAITTDAHEDALSIPVRAVKYREDGQTYVLAKDTATGEPVEKDVAVGLRSSDGFFQVLSGLSEGDVVLIAA